MAKSSVSNQDLYNAITDVRRELKGDIVRLESKFDTLEAGRLTRLEGRYSDLALELQRKAAELENRESVSTTKITTLIAILVFIATLIANWAIKKL